MAQLTLIMSLHKRALAASGCDKEFSRARAGANDVLRPVGTRAFAPAWRRTPGDDAGANGRQRHVADRDDDQRGRDLTDPNRVTFVHARTSDGSLTHLAPEMSRDSVRTCALTVTIDPTPRARVVTPRARVTTTGLRVASWSLAGLDVVGGHGSDDAGAACVTQPSRPSAAAAGRSPLGSLAPTIASACSSQIEPWCSGGLQ